MKGNSSKKKLIVAATLVGVVLLAAVISVVAVLAAATQTVTSTINVSYRLDDVAATVSARYYQPAENAKINWATPTAPGEGETFELVDVDSATEGNEGVKFTTDDKKAGGVFTFPAITLTSTYDFVIFEYNFTNDLIGKSITVSLTSEPTPDNMTVKYATSASRLEGNSVWEAAGYTEVTADSTLVESLEGNSALTLAGGASVSVYIMVEVTDLNKAANYTDGGFTWNIALAD